MRDLRVYVERIVRPIRGANYRKDRMREELLSHLVDSLNQEGQGVDADEAVVERHLARLGPPEDLRREMQATIPKIERLLCFPLDGRIRWTWIMNYRQRREGESETGYAFRMAGFQTLLNSVWAFAFVGWRLVTGQAGPVASILGGAGLLLGYVFLIVFCGTLAGSGGALYLWDEKKRSIPKAVAVLTLILLGFLSFGFSIDLTLGAFDIMRFDDADRIGYVILSLIATFSLPIIYRLDQVDLRRWADWESLEIS